MNKPILNSKHVQITRGPLPGSKKLMVDGVPFPRSGVSGREAPVMLYDTSGPYTDDTVAIDIEKGLAARRRDWILARGDVENIRAAPASPRMMGCAVANCSQCRNSSVTASSCCAPSQAGMSANSIMRARTDHGGNEIHRGAGKSRPQPAGRRQQLRRRYPA